MPEEEMEDFLRRIGAPSDFVENKIDPKVLKNREILEKLGDSLPADFREKLEEGSDELLVVSMDHLDKDITTEKFEAELKKQIPDEEKLLLFKTLPPYTYYKEIVEFIETKKPGSMDFMTDLTEEDKLRYLCSMLLRRLCQVDPMARVANDQDPGVGLLSCQVLSIFNVLDTLMFDASGTANLDKCGTEFQETASMIFDIVLGTDSLKNYPQKHMPDDMYKAILELKSQAKKQKVRLNKKKFEEFYQTMLSTLFFDRHDEDDEEET